MEDKYWVMHASADRLSSELTKFGFVAWIIVLLGCEILNENFDDSCPSLWLNVPHCKIAKTDTDISRLNTFPVSNKNKTSRKMPLSQAQRKTLREALSEHIDSLFTLPDSTVDHYLHQVIENVDMSPSEAISILKQNRDLIQELLKAINLADNVRNDMNKLLQQLEAQRPIIPQSLFYGHPNYNPMNIVEMKQFGDSLIAAEIDEPYLSSLIALRETYLEMTPLVEIKGESNVFKCRIGNVPLDLDNLGVDLSPGEISEEVVEYITIRLQLKSELEQGRKRLEEENLEKINSVNEGTEIPRRENGELGSSPSNSPSIVPYSLENNFINGSSGDIQCYLGLKCQFDTENNNITKAIYWYKKAAEQDHLLALVILECCYLEGLGVEKNYKIADEFFRKFNQYLKHYKGAIKRNEDRDNALSFKFLEQMASDQQNQVVQYLMGECCYYGIGIRKSYEEAEMVSIGC